MKRKLLSLLMVLSLMLGMLPVSAFAALSPDTAGFYELNTDTEGPIGFEIAGELGINVADVVYDPTLRHHITLPEGSETAYVSYAEGSVYVYDGKVYGYAVDAASGQGETVTLPCTQGDDGSIVVSVPVFDYMCYQEENGAWQGICFVPVDMDLQPVDVLSFSWDVEAAAFDGLVIPDGTNIRDITEVTAIVQGEDIGFLLWGMEKDPVPSFTASVPEGTETVVLTFVADTYPAPYNDYYTGELSLSGGWVTYNEEDGSYSGKGASHYPTAVGDTHSIELDVADMVENGKYYCAYDTANNPIYLLGFEYTEAEAEEVSHPFLSVSIDGVALAEENIELITKEFKLGDYAEDEQQETEDYYDYVHTVPYYHVTVPCGTESVDVTYSAETNILASGNSAYGYKTDLALDAVSSATVKGNTFRNAYTLNDDGTQTVKTPVTGYTFDAEGNGHAITLEEDGDGYAAICLFSFKYDGENHVYDEGVITTEPSCEDDGVKTYTCSCGHSYTEAVDAKGHDYTGGVCGNCGASDPDYVAPGPEIPEGMNIESISNVTSIVDGDEMYYCQWGTFYENPAMGYIAEVPEGTETVSITFKAGSHPDPYGNNISGAKTTGEKGFSDSGIEYFVTGGTENEAVQEESGLYTITLNVNDYLLSDNHYYGAYDPSYAVLYFLAFKYPEGAHEHSYTEEITTEPTCTAEGVKTYTCSCNDSYTETIPATGHSYDAGLVTTQPSCVAEGEKTYTCTVCAPGTEGHTKTEAVSATGHKYDEGIVTIEATCIEKGEKTYTCTNTGCTDETTGHTKTETISASGHNYVDGECTRCGDVCPAMVDGVYQIGTEEELLWFANAVNNGSTALNAVLTADITLSSDWPGIGNTSNKFSGSFDGAGNTVTLDDSTFGLFAYVLGSASKQAVIKNVITDGTVKNTALAHVAGYVNITDCINKADVTGGNGKVAGIVGSYTGVTYMGLTDTNIQIINCGNEGDIKGASDVGGILGYTQAGTTLDGCYNTGVITGSSAVGGLVGYMQKSRGTCELKNSYNRGKVESSSGAGIIGSKYNGVDVTNCYNAGTAEYALAAVIYNNTGSFINCYYDGSLCEQAVPAKCSNNSAYTQGRGETKTMAEMTTEEFAGLLGTSFKASCPGAVLTWQTASEHSLVDGVCSVCKFGSNEKTQYNVSFSTGVGYTIIGENRAADGETYIFTVSLTEGYQKADNFSVTAGDYTVIQGENGQYSIENVNSPINIVVGGVELIPATLRITLPKAGQGYTIDYATYNSDCVEVSDTALDITREKDFVFTVSLKDGFVKGDDFKVTANDVTLLADEDGKYTVSSVVRAQEIKVVDVEQEWGKTSVDIWFEIGQAIDTIFETDKGLILAPQKLTVPYFDLALYGLEKYYYNPNCYDGFNGDSTAAPGSQSGQVAGTPEQAYGNITVMHAYVVATEVFCLGIDPENAGKGSSYIDGSFQKAIEWSQDAGSSFITNFWGHDCNLNYYVNYEYPLGAVVGTEGWGATSDQWLIKDGDIVSAHFIEGAGTGSIFNFFMKDNGDGQFNYAEDTFVEATVKQGEELTLALVGTRVSKTFDGTNYKFENDYQVFWLPKDELDNVVKERFEDVDPDTDETFEGGWYTEGFGHEELKTDESGYISLDTSDVEPGVYYIAAPGSEAVRKETGLEPGVAVFKLIVEEADAAAPEANGDINGDGELDNIDASLIYAVFNKQKTFTDEQLANADVNADGIVDNIDAALVYAMFNKQISAFPKA